MKTILDNETLLKIIKIQTEVVQQGIDLSSIMNIVVHRVQELTDSDGAIIEFVEEDEIVYSSTAGKAENFLGMRFKVDSSLSGECIRLDSILICKDSENDDRVNKNATRKVGLRSMVVIPLKHLDTIVGVLKIFSNKISFFDETHIEIMKLMSELIAAAMFSAIKNEATEIFKRATYDQLTGIPNRALFYDRFRQKLSQAQKLSEKFGVISIDMDGLKYINDTFGHRAGDASLKELAHRIHNSIRKSDTLARLGGDEFGIITHKIKQEEELVLLIKKIELEISKPFRFEKNEISLRASIGFSIFSEDGDELDILLEKADQAMYIEKRTRKSKRTS